MIKKLSIKNFKSFNKEQDIHFAPITLFYGRNNSGKSTIFDLLTLLSENSSLQSLQVDNKIKGSPINLIHGYEKLSEIGFKITFCDEYFMYKSLRSSHPNFEKMNSRGSYDLSLHDTMTNDDLFYEIANQHQGNHFFEPKKELNFGINYLYNNEEDGFFANSYFYQIISNGEYFKFKAPKKENKDIIPKHYLFNVEDFKTPSIDILKKEIYKHSSLILNSLETNKNILESKKKEIAKNKKIIVSLTLLEKFILKFEKENKEIKSFFSVLAACVVRLSSTKVSKGDSKEKLKKISTDYFVSENKRNNKNTSSNFDINKMSPKKFIFDATLISENNSGEKFTELFDQIYSTLKSTSRKHSEEGFDEFLLKSFEKKIYDKNFIDKNFSKNNFSKTRIVLIQKYLINFLTGLAPALSKDVDKNLATIRPKTLRYLREKLIDKNNFYFFVNLSIYLFALNQINKNSKYIEDLSDEYYKETDKSNFEYSLTRSSSIKPDQITLFTEKNNSYHHVFLLVDHKEAKVDFQRLSIENIPLNIIEKDISNNLKQINYAIKSIREENLDNFFKQLLLKTFSSHAAYNEDQNLLKLDDFNIINKSNDRKYFDRYYSFFENILNKNFENKFPDPFTPSALRHTTIRKSTLSDRNGLVSSVVNISLPSLLKNFRKADININLIKRSYIKGDKSLFDGKSFKLLNSNLKKFGIDDVLEVKEFVHLNENYFSVYLKNTKGHLTNIIDIGVGLKRILILLTCLDFNEKIIYLEEPESNIHPEFQKGIGSGIVESWLNGNSQILVETHSEQLILRVLREIREGKLNHNDLSVNYVSNENSETVVKNIRVDERGRFLDVWPQGFFNERLSEF